MLFITTLKTKRITTLTIHNISEILIRNSLYRILTFFSKWTPFYTSIIIGK